MHRIQVRRFFCSNAACTRKTFAEPFADLAVAHARRTARQASYDYLRPLQEQPAWTERSQTHKKSSVHAASQGVLSAREAAWLFVCNPRKLRLAQAVRIDYLRRMDEETEPESATVFYRQNSITCLLLLHHSSISFCYTVTRGWR